MISDLLFVFQWWFIWFILGLGFLPLTTVIFSDFFDKGYIFGKILGLLILGYAVWFLGSLKILPFALWSILLIFFIFSLLNLKLLKSSGLLKLPKIFFFEEALFLGGLIFWSFVRAHEPSIHGLEKFMDFGFINSILKSDYFPPKDLWMAPLSVNYYYFGHFTSALLTKVSGINSVISYNLTLASLFALTLTASFSLGANLVARYSSLATRFVILGGLLSAFLVTLGGNLQTIYAFFQNYSPDNPLPFWQLSPMLNFIGYWYPNATRFIPFTIHEFPLYSFVVADLHGHVFNIPFVLLLLALLMAVFFSKLDARRYTLVALFALLIAVSLMTNILDGPIYLLVIFLVLLAKKLTSSQTSLKTLIAQIALITLGAILFSLPFWLSFKPFSSGIGVLCAPSFLIKIGKLGPFLFEADHCQKSPLWMLFILWGFFYLVILGFIFFVLKLEIRNWKLIRNLKLEIRNSTTDILVLTLALTATILIIIPEFFYAKDIYPAHYRANTIFKFGYQAFVILGLISGYMITRIISKFEIRNSKFLFPYCLILIPLFFLVAIYPYFAIKSYYGDLKNYQSLNGLNYLSPLYPSDYQAILWLRENIAGQPIILEAQGDSYTDFARVSANTGLPTIIGWPVHEWLWRGSYDEAGKRGMEVAALYESPDLELTQDLLKKYHVEYIFIGTLERQKYLNLNEEKFNHLGKIVFQEGTTKIYRLTTED